MPDVKKTLIERLFVHHRTALQAFFYRRLKGKDDAADLVQEVYLRMLRVKDTDAIKNPEGYLFAVAGNLVYEQSILNRRQPSISESDLPVDRDAAGAPAGFDEAFDLAARVARLREVLTQLPPKCQAAVYMKYQHGLKYEEIARQLDISSHMVQKYLGIALAHCRRRMAGLK